jgi:hypothetical protein
MNVSKLEKDIFNGLLCGRLLLFDRIYRIPGIFFLSPFPDERVKTNPPAAAHAQLFIHRGRLRFRV